MESVAARPGNGVAEAGRTWLERWWPALVVGAITAVGFALRVASFGDSLFGDELATHWTAGRPTLVGVVEAVQTDQELTPPLYYVLAWFGRQIGNPLVWVRLPSLLAGTLVIPLVYVLGMRTVGRPAALVGSGLFALNQFMIFYAVEARSYSVALLLVMLATLSVLAALRTGQARWWVAYALCTVGTIYTHYTAAFTLGMLAVWVLWSHPRQWLPLLAANAVAGLAFVPWIPYWLDDTRSPFSGIGGAIQPFGFRHALDQWLILAVGRPFANLSEFLSDATLILIGAGLAVALAGFVILVRRGRIRLGSLRPESGLVLLALLAVAGPLGAAFFSIVSDDIFISRNISASLPPLTLLGAALVTSGPGRVAVAATGLVLAGFAVGAVRSLEVEHRRPDYRAVASLIDESTNPGAPILDFPPPSPGPPTELEAEVDRLAVPHRVYRLGLPPRPPGPVTPEDVFQVPPEPRDVTREAIRAAGDGSIALVQSAFSFGGAQFGPEVRELLAERYGPPREEALYRGVAPVSVEIYGDG